MEQSILIKGSKYDIPAILSIPKATGKVPCVILCHGTASDKHEVGRLFDRLAQSLLEIDIASIRFDFPSCGESKASGFDYTFLNEVRDTSLVYEYLKSRPEVDAQRLGILGFSQGARVMAEVLGPNPLGVKTAVSWSGTMHDGIGVFQEWFDTYYEQAEANGYVPMPFSWSNHLIIPFAWFNEIKYTTPMQSIKQFSGSVLAIAGKRDRLVPYEHAMEIISACQHQASKYLIYDDLDHIFNVLKTPEKAQIVIEDTVSWFNHQLSE